MTDKTQSWPWRGWMALLACILAIAIVGLSSAITRAQETDPTDPPPADQADPADTLYEILTQADDGYYAESAAGNLVRVWFAAGVGGPVPAPAIGPGGVVYIWTYEWDGPSAILRADTAQFRILDGNVIDIAGLYFVLSHDGVLFQIDWDAVRVYPGAWM